MALNKINITNFLQIPAKVPVLDVRSPGEYAHGHIPGAISMPLFTDEERREIGTAYKQQSRETAIKIGLSAFGPKLLPLVEQAEKLAGKEKQLRIHCWRGGMRSGAVAWLLDLYGFKVHVLAGGYKAYRHHVLEVLGREYPLLILGGCTGANKTGLLHALHRDGARVIDLEGLAGHKGSAFGNLDQETQPSQEHFENLLAADLERLAERGPDPIWVEAESQRIGLINIPQPFFTLMRRSPMLFMDIPFEKRLTHILGGYGAYHKEKLINAILRIKKKLGGLETKLAVNALLEDNVEACFHILLKYYDKLYLKSTKEPEHPDRVIHCVATDTVDASHNLKKVLAHVNTP